MTPSLEEIREIVEMWIPEIDWDCEDSVSSAIAETNCIFHFDVCEDITVVADDDAFVFNARFDMIGEPRKDDVPFCGDTINVHVEGRVIYDLDSDLWEVEDDYTVWAGVEEWRGEEYDDYPDRIDEILTLDADEIIRQLSSGTTGYWYRGHGVGTWTLQPTIARQVNATQSLEEQLADEFERKIAYLDNVRYPLSKPELYFLMQHHGLPTRLLDWTSSPLVALFFAVENSAHDDQDACIWRLDPQQLNRVYRENNLVRISDDLFSGATQPKVLAIRAHHTNQRMSAQKAEFTVHRDYSPMEHDLTHAVALRKSLVIPKRTKDELRQKLLVLGIDRATLFPDLDNIARTVAQNVL